MKPKGREIFKGLFWGYVLGTFASNFFDLFYDGFWWLRWAGNGEPGAAGAMSVFSHRLVNQPVLWLSMVSFMGLGVGLGQFLQKHRIRMIAILPGLFLLALYLAGFWSIFLTKPSGMCGTERLVVQKGMVFLLTVSGFCLSLFLAKTTQILRQKRRPA